MPQPTSPVITPFSGLIFPGDLSSYRYFMTFTFHKYQRENVFAEPTISIADTPIALPMPEKINDHQVINWQSTKMTEEFKSLGKDMIGKLPLPGIDILGTTVGIGSELYGYRTGQIINPFLIMLFKEPTFKQFTFTWFFTPKNASESAILDKILRRFRRNVLPEKTYGGFVLQYPYIVKPQFVPPSLQDKFMFPFKFCAVTDVKIDYTAAGGPSFFVSDAPTAVRLDITMTEIDLWMRNDPELQKGL